MLYSRSVSEVSEISLLFATLHSVGAGVRAVASQQGSCGFDPQALSLVQGITLPSPPYLQLGPTPADPCDLLSAGGSRYRRWIDEILVKSAIVKLSALQCHKELPGFQEKLLGQKFRDLWRRELNLQCF